MASGTIVGEGGGNDGGAREKQRYTESKVYTRKAFKGPRNNNKNLTTPTPTLTTTTTTTATTRTAANNNNGTNLVHASTPITPPVSAASPVPSPPKPPAPEPETLPAPEPEAQPAPIPAAEPASVPAAEPTPVPAAENDTISKHGNGENITETRGENNSIQVPELEKPAQEDSNSAEQQPISQLNANSAEQQPISRLNVNSSEQQPISHLNVNSDDSSSLNRQQGVVAVASSDRDLATGNGVVAQGSEDKVKINLASKSKQEMRELRKKLEGELDMVRNLVKKIEDKEDQLGIGRINTAPISLSDGIDKRLRRVHSEVGSVGGVPREITTPLATPTPRQSRPLNQLSISVLENSQAGSEIVEKEKRTPKANQFYRNSEFLLAKDKFPPAESNKKSKLNGKKQSVVDLVFGPTTKVFKNCSALLDRLMKHKHAWVFNTPVDVKGLGLHDYFTIIKHPMDLGTVKTRLNKNWYKSPEEFAEDVRLTFHNALRYNPKGQDVHIMAEQMLAIFEDKWPIIKLEYDRETRFAPSYELGMPTPTSRKTPLFPPLALDMRRILDRSESMTYPPGDFRSKPLSTTPSSRTPAPKKPKAKDPHKRDMTYEEKQKLSTNLQSLPSEKLDNIVQIIKKRNSTLFQHDDEIEVDIDSVDAETLWELDRFVTNYKKSLSKNKRKAEIQARAEAEKNARENMLALVVAEPPRDNKTVDGGHAPTASPVQVANQGDNGTRSSSSSSSSSDSGSSSSESDSDSSSASGSDVGH